MDLLGDIFSQMSILLLLSPECKGSSGCFWRSGAPGMRERRAAALSPCSQAGCHSWILCRHDSRQLCSPCPSSSLIQLTALTCSLQVRPESPAQDQPQLCVRAGTEPRSPESPPRAARVSTQVKTFLQPSLPMALQLQREPNTHHRPPFQQELWTGKTQNC